MEIISKVYLSLYPAIKDNFTNKYAAAKYNMFDAENGVFNLSGTISSHSMNNRLGVLPVKELNTNDNTKAFPKLGYGINYSLQTIGDYGETSGKKLTIIPSYKIDGMEVTNIKYIPDSKTLEKIYDTGTNKASYILSNSLYSQKAKLNKVSENKYEYGDIVEWSSNEPKGIKFNNSGGINIESNINNVLIGTPSHMVLPVNLRTFIGYSGRSEIETEVLSFKVNANDNTELKKWNTNHQRWFGQFSLPSSSVFYTNSDTPVDTFKKTVLVNFKIITDTCDAGWSLQATNSVTQSGKPDTNISVVEFDIFETSAKDMTVTGTH